MQAMVFGNMGNTSGTGVCFTRNPATGEKKLYGEYLVNAQGEDVVAGIRTPGAITDMDRDLPEAYKLLVKNCEILEKSFKDMQVGAWFELVVNGSLLLAWL
jgi:pyruvate, orthophosphate dikinase